jgi:hypothetical protein
MSAEHYSDRRWELGADIFGDACEKWQADDTALAETGYQTFFSVGAEDGFSTPVALVVYVRNETPRAFVSIDTPVLIRRVYFDSLADAMDVVARWAPIVQAAALADLSSQLNGGEGAGLLSTLTERLTKA